MARQPYERRLFRSRSRLAARNATYTRRQDAEPRGIREFLGARPPWTNGPAYFSSAPARPRQTVRFRWLWTAVDKWITCAQSWSVPGVVSGRPGCARGSVEPGSDRA